MRVHAATRGERTLRRVIALLFSFALLAERAANRPPAIRLFVLWLLRRAEVLAVEFAFAMAGEPLPAGDGSVSAGNEPADALHLCARLRMLAGWLASLLPDTCRSDRSTIPCRPCSCRVLPFRGRVGGGCPPTSHDTS